MKLLLYILFLFSVCFTATSQQQTLDIKRDFQKPYEKQTRSLDGRPGKNYFQNSSDYVIHASVDEENKYLTGKETITYYNNSSDSLDRIVIRIAQDIYKKESYRNQPIRAVDLTDGVEIKKLIINGVAVNMDDRSVFRRPNTNAIAKLTNKILPHSKTIIEVEWRFLIPQVTHLRMGKADEGSFFIAYWYPEVAVYDDVRGWDTDDYEGMQEFYHDANNYEVSIEMKNNYGVWATGELQNAGDIFNADFLQRLNAAYAGSGITKLITKDDYSGNSFPVLKNKAAHTWKFKATQCPDFAFSFGNRFLWDAAGITLKDGRRIKLNAVYRPEATDFPEVCQFAKNCIDYLSHVIPGVPYPYPQMTVVHGSPMGETGGMEFPMICNDPGAVPRPRSADVTSHEIAHTYFPFYVLTNERSYAWMDEGWAAMLPAGYMMKEVPESNRLTRYVREMNNYTFGFSNDLPIFTPSHSLDSYNYFGASYSKPALAYHFLREELGDALFAKTLQTYMSWWAYKHPTPYDFFFSFNTASGKNLNWFWQKWFFEAGSPDLSVTVTSTKKASIITIQRKGELPVPVALKIIYNDGREETMYQTVGIWANGKKEITITKKAKIKQVVLGNEYIPDIAPADNNYTIVK